MKKVLATAMMISATGHVNQFGIREFRKWVNSFSEAVLE